MTASDRAKDRFDFLKDIYLSVVFLTRLPAPDWPAAAGRKLARAMWAFPVAGVLAATVAGFVYAVADMLAWPTLVCALLAIAALAIVTGALHEDGLSDLADGVWGGSTRERRLEIMSDSRIGAFGALALILSVGARASAIAELGDPAYVLGALVAAAALSRGVLPAAMAFSRPAKPDGLGATAGQPEAPVWAGAFVLAIAIAALAAPGGWLMAAIVAVAGALLVGWFAARAVGGYTGDTLGATQQVAEIFALAAIAAAAPVALD